MRSSKLALLFIGLISSIQCVHNVLDYGAVGSSNDTKIEFQNANAF